MSETLANYSSTLQSFQPELIFFDVDGTLLNAQGQYSPELKQQLNRLSEKGVKLAVASGRPAIAAQFLFDELPLTDAGLFCTGAELYDPIQQQHLKLNLLDHSLLIELHRSIFSLGLYCEFYTPEFYTAEESVNDITQIHSQHLRVNPKILSGSSVLEQELPITKLLLGANESTHGQALRVLANSFPSLEFAFAHFLARPGWLFASVISSDSDKNIGFQELIDYHQVNPRRVMAFGDSHSDQIFLKRAEIGVAMGNALDEIKRDADMVTLSADNNGVAAVLEQLYTDVSIPNV